MPDDLLTDADLEQLARRGITAAQARRQLELLASLPPPVALVRPCTVGDGIVRLDVADHERLLGRHAAAARAGRFTKLVPASGAASRMFASLQAALDAPEQLRGDAMAPAVAQVMANLDRFAFFPGLEAAARRQGRDLAELRRGGDAGAVIRLLLAPEGLGYAAAPKGLVAFHRAADGVRTAFVEHLDEGIAYLADGAGRCRFHLTVPAEAREDFAAALATARPALERRHGVHLDVTFSVQDPATDTLALDGDGRPLRDARGELVLRPGGHGALLRNLAACGGDLVLVKNIDNVLPDAGRPEVVLWKRLLAGLLAELEGERNAWALALEGGEGDLAGALDFVTGRLGARAGDELAAAPRPRVLDWVRDRLDRPLRVCGMVPNAGEPGGGPFWVRDAAGQVSPQVVEASQVSRGAGQQAVLAAATHFNPVDLACGLRDHRGRPFDVERFVDPGTSFVSEKSVGGDRIVVLEWPGLWNGAMAGWSTVFVEVPAATFAPVKTVLDLLRPEHQA